MNKIFLYSIRMSLQLNHSSSLLNMRLILFAFCAFLYSVVLGCKPGPEEYILKAKEALNDQNPLLAIKYFHEAYEISLDKKFFLTDREKKFSNLYLSQNKKHLILLQNLNNSSSFIYRDLSKQNKKEIEEDIDAKTIHLNVSPKGTYILFVLRSDQKGKCDLNIWEVSKRDFIDPKIRVDCIDQPAISDEGYVLYKERKHIMFLDIKKSLLKPEMWTSRTPDIIYKKQTAKASFYFSPKNRPFLTFGKAGLYKLYDLSNRGLKLINKNLARGKIYFKKNMDHSGAIIGGAGKYSLSFFDPNFVGRVIKSYKLGIWKDISFINEGHYFFIQSGRIHEHNDEFTNKTRELPFFAKNIFADEKGNLFFLSILGTPMRYKGETISQLNMKIFDKIIDLQE